MNDAGTTNTTGNSVLIFFAICAAGLISYLATFSHAGVHVWYPVLIATAISLFGCLPPLWFSRWINNGPSRQLAVIAWRLGILLPSVALGRHWEVAERNCFITALLACYFVALPLESWLLIRDIRRAPRL